jgi:hypothetical protein
VEKLAEPFYHSRHQLMKGHNSAGMNQKSVQAQPLLGHFSQSDVRYWQRAVFRQSYTGNGRSFLAKAWAMKVAYEDGVKRFRSVRLNKAADAAQPSKVMRSPSDGWRRSMGWN